MNSQLYKLTYIIIKYINQQLKLVAEKIYQKIAFSQIHQTFRKDDVKIKI